MAPYFQRMKLVSSSWLRPRTILDQTTTVTLGTQRVNKNIALTTVHISRYCIPKSPKNHQIPLMQPLTACLFI